VAGYGAVPHTFPRPEELHFEAQRHPVEGSCAECGAAELAEYRVLGEGGWWGVRDGYVTIAGTARDYAVVVVGGSLRSASGTRSGAWRRRPRSPRRSSPSHAAGEPRHRRGARRRRRAHSSVRACAR